MYRLTLVKQVSTYKPRPKVANWEVICRLGSQISQSSSYPWRHDCMYNCTCRPSDHSSGVVKGRRGAVVVPSMFRVGYEMSKNEFHRVHQKGLRIDFFMSDSHKISQLHPLVLSYNNNNLLQVVFPWNWQNNVYSFL